jgi:hypothetical protein
MSEGGKTFWFFGALPVPICLKCHKFPTMQLTESLVGLAYFYAVKR